MLAIDQSFERRSFAPKTKLSICNDEDEEFGEENNTD